MFNLDVSTKIKHKVGGRTFFIIKRYLAFGMKVCGHKDLVMGLDLALFSIIINLMGDEIETCISYQFCKDKFVNFAKINLPSTKLMRIKSV